MAAPTPPTLALITAEGIKKAGYASGTTQYNTALTRSQDSWMEEVKHDIWATSKKLKSLQTQYVQLLTYGVSKYSFPTDFSSILSMSLLSGNQTGSCQAGSTTGNVILASTEDLDTTWMVGKEIAITSGTGIGQITTVTAYDNSTKTATVSPAWSTAPAENDTYLVVEEETMLDEAPVWDVDKFSVVPTVDEPSMFYTLGDNDNGEFYVKQVPNNTSTYAARIRYYADLTRIDLAGTLMATLYRRWRNTFIQGVYCKALQDLDDNRYMHEMSVYDRLLKQLQSQETYGMDISNLQATVVE